MSCSCYKLPFMLRLLCVATILAYLQYVNGRCFGSTMHWRPMCAYSICVFCTCLCVYMLYVLSACSDVWCLHVYICAYTSVLNTTRPVHCPRLRLLARGVGCFLHCQLPVDKEHKTQLRVTPNALGFVRDTDTLGGYHPTKAAEQGLKSLTNCQVTSPTMPSRKTLPTSVTLCATPRIM